MGSEAVFVGGRSGVGKSSVALEAHARLSDAGLSHCLIDGGALDMAHPPPWEHNLAERNLPAMWQNYRTLGYGRMLYTNTVSVIPGVTAQLTDAMGDDPTVTAILLICSDATARQRLGQRETGSSLGKHLKSSAAMADLLERGLPATVHRVVTDGRTVSDVAEEVIALTGWLSSPP